MNNRGVSVISLVVTIIVLILITSATIYNGINMLDRTRQTSTMDRLMTVATSVVSHEKELGFEDTYIGGGLLGYIGIDTNGTPDDYTDDILVNEDDSNNIDIYNDGDVAFNVIGDVAYNIMGLENFSNNTDLAPIYIIKAPNIENKSELIYILKTPKAVKRAGNYTKDDFLWYEYRVFNGEVKDNYKMEFDEQKGVNRPLLTDDMVPVINYFAGGDFDRFSPVFVNDVYKEDWYNYSKESPMWANVMFRDSTDPTVIANRFYVWIPRFAYKVQDFYKGTDYSDIPESAIDIIFLREDTDYMQNDDIIPTGYQVHPAFKYVDPDTIGDPEPKAIDIPGFWVAKDYIQTVNSVITSPSSSEKSALEVTDFEYLHPNVSDATKAAVTSRLMTNTEWAAVAYLSLYTIGKTQAGNSLGKNPSGIVNLDNDSGHYVAAVLSSYYDRNKLPYADIYYNNGGLITYDSFESNSDTINQVESVDSLHLPYRYNNSERKYGDAMVITSLSSGDNNSWYGGYSERMTTDKPYLIRGDAYGNMFSYRAVPQSGTSAAARNVLIIKNK